MVFSMSNNMFKFCFFAPAEFILCKSSSIMEGAATSTRI